MIHIKFIYNVFVSISSPTPNKERVSVKADNPFDLYSRSNAIKVLKKQASIKQRNIRLRLLLLSGDYRRRIHFNCLVLYYCDNRYWRDAHGMAKLIGVSFLFGTDFVLFCGADLSPYCSDRWGSKLAVASPSGQLAKNWLNVYFGNLIGALLS